VQAQLAHALFFSFISHLWCSLVEQHVMQ
jgi:hypothetical protein